MKIAVYTIALNEEKHVNRWYEATKDADYHLIADTGSTDKTIDIAKSLGINVVKISVVPFRFDDARNAALSLLPHDIDICLSLDMDEVAENNLIKNIKNKWKEDTTRGWIWWDTGGKWKNNNRLHSRKGYRWIKPCHEVITKSFSDIENVIEIDSVVYHKPDNSKSRSYYLPMLEQAVKEDSRDARMWHYLMREYYFYKKWDKIIENKEKSLENIGWYVERSAICRYIGQAFKNLNKNKESKEWFLRSVKESKDQIEPWFFLAEHFYQNQDWKNCWDSAIKIEELEKQTHYLVDNNIWNWRCYDLLSISAWNLGYIEKSYYYSKKALEGNPLDNRLKDNLILIENSERLKLLKTSDI
jgi:glycosyltransferase involved in cell wall biosynthesis